MLIANKAITIPERYNCTADDLQKIAEACFGYFIFRYKMNYPFRKTLKPSVSRNPIIKKAIRMIAIGPWLEVDSVATDIG